MGEIKMENKKKVVAFVPMKLNNERLPGKNTKAFKGGKPLLTYILDTLTKVEGIDETYVYCSNEEVKKYLPNGIKFLKRSESLDTSSTLIIDVLKAFAEDVDADIYVLAHATAPFIKAKTIEIPRTQDIQNVFAETTGLYVYTKKLIKDGRRIGSNPYGVTVNFIEATDINNPIDFDLAQVIFDYYIKNNTESDNNGNNE